MLELTQEDYKYRLPMGDRFLLTVVAEMDVYGDERIVEGYELRDVWNETHDRAASVSELENLTLFLGEIGDSIDWDWIYFNNVEDEPYYENDCND